MKPLIIKGNGGEDECKEGIIIHVVSPDIVKHIYRIHVCIHLSMVSIFLQNRKLEDRPIDSSRLY